MDVLNIHGILPRSRANGPGTRMVIWFQGCSLRCPGCFNPRTHPHAPKLQMPVVRLVSMIEDAQNELEGITISGGEPLEQAEGLSSLLTAVRERTALSIILFSGYTLREIKLIPRGRLVLMHVDVLIAGRFVSALRLSRGLRGSSNQAAHLLSGRYNVRDIIDTPVAEISIDRQGVVSASGIDPPDVAPGSGLVS